MHVKKAVLISFIHCRNQKRTDESVHLPQREFRLSFDSPICDSKHFPLNVAKKHEEKWMTRKPNWQVTEIKTQLVSFFPSKHDRRVVSLCDDHASLFDFGGTQLFFFCANC